MKDIICIGMGYVGKATAHAFGIKNWYTRNDKTIKSEEEIVNFKYIFVCLPTPTINGKQDISAIEYYLEKFSGKDNIFIIRSTVLPGTCRTLAGKYKANIVHVPEFLTEATWKEDAEWPDIVVIGADNNKVRDEVVGIFKARYKGASYFITDTVTSEMIKYAINTFYSLKVVYSNSLFDLSNKIGANYETIKKACYARKWVTTNHFDIWHKGGRGAGNPCLAKDLQAFVSYSNLPLLQVANELNRELLIKYPKSETSREAKNGS